MLTWSSSAKISSLANIQVGHLYIGGTAACSSGLLILRMFCLCSVPSAQLTPPTAATRCPMAENEEFTFPAEKKTKITILLLLFVYVGVRKMLLI